MYSTYITGHTLSDSEDTDAVIKTWEQADTNPVSMLSDNGSGNTSTDAQSYLKERGVIGTNIYPHHPQTNGIIENIFSQYEHMIGTIRIMGKTAKDMARSIGESVTKAFVSGHNYMPKKSLQGLTPYDVYSACTASKEEKETAHQELRRQAKRSKTLRAQKELSEEKKQYIEQLLKTHRFTADREKSILLLGRYDTTALEQADIAFSVYKQKECFNETKNTLPYFCGIVKNKQKDIDYKHQQEHLKKIYANKEQWQRKEQMREIAREEKQLQYDIKTNPEKVLLDHVQLSLDCAIETRLYDDPIRASIKRIITTRIDYDSVIEQLCQQINLWCQYKQLKRQKIIDKINAWVKAHNKH